MRQVQEQQITDEELVESYQKTRCREDLELLLDRYQTRIRRAALGMVLDSHDADDLTQEIFIRVIRGIDGFDGRSKFSTWLYRVGMNTAHRFLDGRRRRGNADLLDHTAGPRTEEPDQLARQTELHDQITTAMSALSPSLRAALTLVALQGLSMAQAAEIEGCGKATMYWRIHEARKTLRKRLAKYLSQ